MSGRTFTYQGNFDDFVRYLLPDVEMSDRRKSVGIGDSMLREVEEFLNRFVVTAVNDAGDIIFDAAGSYTFQGDVIIGGELQSSNWVDDTVGWQLRSDGTFEFNSSGDVRGDLGVHGDMTMFTGGAMKTNASGLRAEISEATTSTSIVGGSADFAGVDLFTGDAGELEPGLLGVSNSAAGYSTVVLAGADLAGAAQRSYVYFSSNTSGSTETRLSDPSRTYLTAGSSSVDINQTGINVNVADGDLDLAVKNLPSGSYQDKINLAEDLFTVTLSNAERMRLDTTGLGIGTNAPAVPLHVASSDPEMLRLQLNDTSVAGGYIGFHHNSGRIGYIGFPDNDDLHIKNEDLNGLIYFSTNNTTRMTIQADGDVGIGTTSPGYQLDVNGNLRSSSHIDVTSGTNNQLRLTANTTSARPYLTFNNWNGSSYVRRGYIGYPAAGSATANIQIVADNGEVNLTPKASINGGPELSDPSSANYLRITSAYGNIDLGPQNSTYCHIYTDRSTFYFNKNINLGGVSSSEGGEMVLQNATSYSLDWKVDNYQNQFRIFNSSLSNGDFRILYLNTTTSGNTLRWDSSGRIRRYSSLTEFKEDIQSIDGILGYLNERNPLYDLSPKIFHEKDKVINGQTDNSTRGEYVYGMLAEDVYEVLPELCSTDGKGALLGYSIESLTPLIIAEIQRLGGMVETLYQAHAPDYTPPTPRPSDRADAEKAIFQAALPAERAEYNDLRSQIISKYDGVEGREHIDLPEELPPA